jgi:hypothetical protein
LRSSKLGAFGRMNPALEPIIREALQESCQRAGVYPELHPDTFETLQKWSDVYIEDYTERKKIPVEILEIVTRYGFASDFKFFLKEVILYDAVHRYKCSVESQMPRSWPLLDNYFLCQSLFNNPLAMWKDLAPVFPYELFAKVAIRGDQLTFGANLALHAWIQFQSSPLVPPELMEKFQGRVGITFSELLTMLSK